MTTESRTENIIDQGNSGNTQPASAPTPDPANPGYDNAAIVNEVQLKYKNWRNLKRPNEVQWFINSAVTRGLQNVKWNDTLAQLETRAVPTHKVRPSINLVLPKYRARKAKFLKNRYVPTVIPASTDWEDKLNATASELSLNYVSRKAQLESVYRQTVDWTLQCGKAFIWLYWDDTLKGMIKDPISGKSQEVPIGDIVFDVGNPFEMLVPDIGVQHLADQHEIMRVKAIPLETLKYRYSTVAGIEDLQGDANSDDLFNYQKQIATLATRSNVGYLLGSSDKSQQDLKYVIRKELFSRPCAKYPNGRYVVTAGNLVLKYQDFIPYGFGNDKNPYPVVEFSDIELAGQFWPTSVVEQLIGPQREYNDYRTKIINHLNKCTHPKVIVSVFSKWPENAWNDEAGEVIRIITPPGAMEPKIITPPAISNDIWQAMNTIRGEIDQISSISMVDQGSAGQTTSGFQVNLLQEANDSVHAPDIRGHELAFEELYKKTRKIMAQGYTVPRLINIAGRSHIPDVIEFSQDNIDENAEIIVYTGSALANSPAVRTQQVIELWKSGILVDDQNPAEGKRKALTMLDSNGIGEFQEEKRRDEEKARLENLNIGKSQHVHPPLPFDDHQVHYQTHTDQMKNPEFETWDTARQQELFAHTLMHMKYINPMMAVQTAYELGMPTLVPMLLPPQQMGAPPPQQGGPQHPQAPQQPPQAAQAGQAPPQQ